MQYTNNYELKKPEDSEAFDQQNHANYNYAIIDQTMKGIEDLAKNSPANSVNDDAIGNRTPDQSQIPVSPGIGKFSQLLSWLANRIKVITGKANWWDAPATTLEATKTHIDTTTSAHGGIVPQIRSVNASGGLTGGGDLSANRTISIADSGVTDTKIGNRTISDTSAPTGDMGVITTLFGWLANMIKSITGKTSWRTAPATTLEAAKGHMDAASPHSGHETPAGAQAKVDTHNTAVTGVHGVGTYRVAKTNSANQFPDWSEVQNKPASFTATTHAASHQSGGNDALTLGNIAGTVSDTQHGSRSGGSLHSAATTSTAGFMAAADKTKLNGIAAGAEVNQNTFTTIKIGTTNVIADSKTDTLEVVAGTGITLTPDATNDKVTISVNDSQIALQSEFDAHLADNLNPHATTAAQVGAETPAGAQAKADVAASAGVAAAGTVQTNLGTHAAISATETAKGHVELATAAETTTGTDNTRAVHPAGLKVELDKKVPNTRTVTAGNGLTGGGDLTADRTITLGTPSTLTVATTNAATATSHTHAITAASAATASTIMARDSAGRAKVAAPSAVDDIARKDTVDAVQANLNSHTANTSNPHNVTVAQIGAETPAGAQAKVDTHSGLKQSHGISGSYYIAKTSRSDQLLNFGDLQNKPGTYTPSAHKSTHTIGGGDALIPSDIGAVNKAGDTMTGNLTAPRFVSNVVVGTSPLAVTSTTLVSNLNADLLDGKHAADFAPMSTLNGPATAATAGWYRVATSALNIGSNSGIFKIDFSGAGVIGRVLFLASCQNGVTTGTALSQLGFISSNYALGLTQIRIVYHTTYTANYAYIEVYNPTALAIAYNVDLINTTGWSLVAPNTAGSIPSGYISKTFVCDPGLYSLEDITTEKQLRSKVTTGTKPVDVTSTTLCNNLNADLLDGQHSSYFAPVVSPIFTGTPAAPTATANANTTQIATTAFVVGQAATANPVMNGTVAKGTSLLYARQDHVHPTDTSRAALTDLAAQAAGKGASMIGVQDANNYFTGTNVEAVLNELFTNVSDGKNSIASAITGMGQAASGSDTFAQLVTKISDISDDATAAVSDVLVGKTFYQGGAKKAGTMANQGQKILTPGPSNITIPQGYHSGTGYVAGVSVPAANVLTGTTIAGTAGTMPNQGQKIFTPSTVQQTIPTGYHNGSGYVAGNANLIAGNIKNGVNIFGVVGTCIPGAAISSIQSGTLTSSDAIDKNVTITPVNTSKAILIFSHTTPSSSGGTPIKGILGASNIIFSGFNDHPTAKVTWFVVEFTSGISIQRGVVDFMVNTDLTKTVTISTVDLSKTFLIVYSKGSSSYEYGRCVNGYFASTTQITLERSDSSGTASAAWQVISFI